MNVTRLRPFLNPIFLSGLLSLAIAFVGFLYWRFVPHPPHDGISTLILVLNIGIGFFMIGYVAGRRSAMREVGQAQ